MGESGEEMQPQKPLWLFIGAGSFLCLIVATVSVLIFSYAFYDNDELSDGAPLHPVQRRTEDAPKILACVYYHTTTHRENSITPRYCSHVVVCCSRSLKDKAVWARTKAIQERIQKERVLVGLFATPNSWLPTALMKGPDTANIANKLTSILDKHDVRGGLFLYMPQIDPKTPLLNLRILVKVLAKNLREKNRLFMVSVPASWKGQNMYLTKPLLRHGAYFIKTTHFKPPVEQPGNSTLCSTSFKVGNSTNSLESGMKGILEARFGWPGDHALPGPYAATLRESTLFTFDVGCYEYSVDSRSHMLQKGRHGYDKFCLTQKKAGWKRHEDNETRCQVLRNDTSLLTVSNPKIVADIKSVFANKFAGVVVFNVQRDDVNGVCGGSRFPLTKQVFCELEGQREEACRRLP